MRQAINFFVVLMLLASCKERESFVENRMETAEKFLHYLKKNEPDGIPVFTYAGGSEKITDKASRKFFVNKAYELIEKFDIPPKSAWVISYNPDNDLERLTITIPLFKGYDTTLNLLQADIVIKFPPPQVSDKIYDYDIATSYAIKQNVPVIFSPSAGKIN